MDELLRYYEEELGVFGHFAREFRARYPKPAGALHVAGEPDGDPGVTRLIQSVALLTARIRKRLDDDYPQFTEALLDSLYPHYLRPLPSHTVVQVGRIEGSASLLLPRGTMLRAAGAADGVCRFRTVYDVLLAPVSVRRLGLTPASAAPRRVRLPRGVNAFVSIGIDCGPLADPQALPERLRLFVDGEASLRAALLDTLFLRGGGAWLQAGETDAWLPLPRVPLRLAGLAEADAMLPVPARSHPALRLLTEYFCYPDKFHFIDVDLAALRSVLALLRLGPAGFTLHLAIAGAPDADEAARRLAGLGPANLLAGCTPVINLFPKAGAPLQLSGASADYPLLADSAHAAAYEIHSVDAVRLVRDGPGGHAVTPVAPLYAGAPDGMDQGGAPVSWVVRRDHATAAVSPGHEMRIALLDADYRPLDAAGSTLSVDLTCSNRDLPARLPWGQPGGDLRADELSGLAPIRMLRKPSPGYRFDHARGAHWRLVAHLAPHPAGFSADGLPAFRRMLALYDLPRSQAAQRAIGGIVGLEHGAERAWMPAAPVATLTPGIAVRLTVDEEAYAGSSLAVFAQVLDRYFALNAQLNCYTRLSIVGADGRTILAGTPRLGTWTAP